MAGARVTMASNGRVVIPAGMRSQLGMIEGGPMVARVENGAVILEPIAAAMDRVRDLVRRHAPAGGVSVVDELLAERRAEGERENRE